MRATRRPFPAHGSRLRLACRRAFARAAMAFVAATAAGAALADPGYYVVTVYDDPGIRTADFRYWSTNADDGRAVLWPEVGLGWNVNGRWYTELLASYIGGADVPWHLSTLNWQNDFLLTQGQYPFDFGIHTLWVVPQKYGRGHAIEIGPVFQTDIGRTQVNANLIFERSFGRGRDETTQLKYQWQLRYRWQRWLHVGAQGFGEVGTWDDWKQRDAQSHRAGPAVFGSLPSDGGTVNWQAAWLVGKTYGQRGSMFTARIKYDF